MEVTTPTFRAATLDDAAALPAALLAYRSIDMRAPLLAGALSSGADPAIFGRTSEAGH
jgi:hypothetical protein